jgi:polysaccharide export outer membrane protein
MHKFAVFLCAVLAYGQASLGSYILGGGDEMVIRALDVEEFGALPVRVDMEGNIKVPLIGRLHAAGLTVEELETAIRQKLKVYVVDPDIIVTVSNFRSQPVMVLGAVTTPGVHQLEGRKTLFEVISEVGGVRADAGYTIKLTRQKQWGRIPLAGCTEDQTGQYYVAEVSVKSVMEAKDPQENVLIKPNDVITVPKGQIVYVIGAVKKSGGYVLGDSESMTVLQALALADGLDSFAATNRARIMRVTPGSSERTEIPVDVKRIFEGKGTDVALGGDDILFIPVSGKKKATAKAAEASLGLASGVALYRLGR